MGATLSLFVDPKGKKGQGYHQKDHDDDDDDGGDNYRDHHDSDKDHDHDVSAVKSRIIPVKGATLSLFVC